MRQKCAAIKFSIVLQERQVLVSYKMLLIENATPELYVTGIIANWVSNLKITSQLGFTGFDHVMHYRFYTCKERNEETNEVIMGLWKRQLYECGNYTCIISRNSQVGQCYEYIRYTIADVADYFPQIFHILIKYNSTFQKYVYVYVSEISVRFRNTMVS